MPNLSSLPKASRRLRYVVMLLWLLTFGVAVLRWCVGNPAAWLPPTLAAKVGEGALSFGVRLGGFCLELLPLAAAGYAMLALLRICRAYGRNEVFMADTGVHYRRFGRGLLLLGVANAVYTTLLSMLLSASAGGGQVVVSLGLSSADLYLLIIGVTVHLFGSVMDEAYRIHDENTQIV